MSVSDFHPAVSAWFDASFAAPTPAQAEVWAPIRAGANALVAAPTGSGKTLAAFLAAIDTLVREGLSNGGALLEQTSVVYVSPLKALSNDIRINLETPLQGIREQLLRLGLPEVEIRSMVRTGDTPQAERNAMRKRPPHIVVTTPESLYVLLGSESGRAMLGTTRTLIVDEIHAVAASKRGSHLALSLERLESLCQRPLQRIGLSATQKPIDSIARFLTGVGADAALAPLDQASTQNRATPCTIVDVGYTRARDLALELPPLALGAVMSNDAWVLVYKRIAELVGEHRTTLVFVNTRRMAERAARHLSELLGADAVAAHHGSLSREHRLGAERRLKQGQLRVLVATASLELGIDIGDVDLVCQLGSPRSIAALLQRVGRSGHTLGATPKGRLFPSTLDDLVECAALLDAVRRGELDTLEIPQAPLDVLAQQLVAELGCGEWDQDALFTLVRRAYPYRNLARADFDAVVRMLAEGFSTQRGMRSAYVHRDAVHDRLRGRRNARLTALTSGGTIPDTADYAVVLEPQAQTVGSINEDFAIESMAGDIFQLGNQSYRILRVERDRVRVEDAHGAPPNIPFWLGEAPGRSDELSLAVSRLRTEIATRLPPLYPQVAGHAKPSPSRGGLGGDGVPLDVPVNREPIPLPASPLKAEEIGVTGCTAQRWLVDELGLDAATARQLSEFVAATRKVLGTVPTHDELVMERFFDESGGMQIIIHSPFGSRINRAWGLALRKRFCRNFNFELQAAATEDAIVLSLSTAHSFPLDEVARYLHSNNVEQVLTQALLDAPLFPARWRWNATNALALPRMSGGKKVPAPLQRMRSEDLLGSVFPDQVACLENIVGERKIPDHPLVAQTLHDCLHDAMDIDGLVGVLRGLESGAVSMLALDLPTPSPLAAGVLNAAPYAFLDDAPLEERRTRAVQSRGWQAAQQAGHLEAGKLGALDADAINAVREEAWPNPGNADEMHEALMLLGFVTDDEVARQPAWRAWLQSLAATHRATRLRIALPDCAATTEAPTSACIHVAAERLPEWQAVHPAACMQPAIAAPAECAARARSRENAIVELLRSRLAGLGPVSSTELARSMAITHADAECALASLQGQGQIMRGSFTPGADNECCERHLLARIHRYTMGRLRREIEPVSRRDFMRFLFQWQRVAAGSQVRGPEALAGILTQLEGFEAAAGAWESEILSARVSDYSIAWLDDLCRAGRVVWLRLRDPSGDPDSRNNGPLRSTPMVLLPRADLRTWMGLRVGAETRTKPSSRGQAVADTLRERGALFFDELSAETGLLRSELEDALGELSALGLIHADSFAGLRALLLPAAKRKHRARRRQQRNSMSGIADAGRWSLLRAPACDQVDPAKSTEHVARTLLRRYGVVCWHLLEREASWLPPWRELRRVYQRLEARGELRGGRFIDGLVGEQFALPEAVELLRKVRKQPDDGVHVCISGTDPLNLVGTLLSGSKLPAVSGTRIIYRDGIAIAALVAAEFTPLVDLPSTELPEIRQSLLRRPIASARPSLERQSVSR